MKAAVRSRPAAPAQRTATMRWCPPSPLACPSSRTTARSTPTPTARPEWVSVWMGTCNFLFRCPSLFFFCNPVSERSSPSVRLTVSRCCLSFPPQRRARCVEWWACGMLFTPKRSASAACRVRGAIPPIPKRPASWRDYRWGLPLLPLWCISLTMTSWLILTRFSGAFSGQTTNEKSKSSAETASNGKAGCLRPVPSKSTEPVQIKSWYAFTLQ